MLQLWRVDIWLVFDGIHFNVLSSSLRQILSNYVEVFTEYGVASVVRGVIILSTRCKYFSVGYLKKFRCLSPRVNYTDRATAACR
jgi:hypothetical protein